MQWDCNLKHLKVVTNGHQHTKTTEDEKLYILNKCSYPNWKTNNLTKTEIPPSIQKIMVYIQKFLWSFGFLSRLSTYVFITNCELYGYLYILEIVLDIMDKLIDDSQNVCGCLTLNDMHIKLTSLITCSIIDNLTNTSSTSPPKVKTNSTVYRTFNNFVYYLTVVLLSCGSFFK